MSVEILQVWGSDAFIAQCARMSYGKFNVEYPDDGKLLAALRRKGHWTPMSHAGVTIKVVAPIFVARQLIRHTVGFTWSERSGRYVSANTDYFVPEELTIGEEEEWRSTMLKSVEEYLRMISSGIPREQARALLPQGMMTEWVWSGNVAAWNRLFFWRLDKAAQKETREVVAQIKAVIAPHFPLTVGDAE